jgi:hypothetical protein
MFSEKTTQKVKNVEKWLESGIMNMKFELIYERRPNMKKAIISVGLVTILLFGISPTWADTEWDSGHHDIPTGCL